MKSILISVIMPIYNSEEYLKEAIQHIVDQTYTNWELICIDDASIDNSKAILLSYAEKDNRIKVFENKSNLGAAKSRNRGIELAQGQYIYFVDADDTYEANLLEEVLYSIEKENPDIVYVDYDTFKNGEVYNNQLKSEYYYFGRSLSLRFNRGLSLRSDLCTIPLAPYGRMYRKEFVLKNNLYFQDIKSSNDVYFSLLSAILSGKSSYIHRDIYLYHVREHSGQFRISNKRDPFNSFLAYLLVTEELKKRHLWEKLKNDIHERFLLSMFYELQNCSTDSAETYISFLGKEGLFQLGFFEDVSGQEYSDFCQSVVQYINCKEHGREWYREKTWFYFFINSQEEKICSFFQKLQKNGKKYAIWGAGQYGKNFAEFCRTHNLECEGIIDNDKNKWGSTLYGYNIYSPEQLIDKIDVVVVTNVRWFNGIYEQVLQLKEDVIVFSLDMYLRYGNSILQDDIFME